MSTPTQREQLLAWLRTRDPSQPTTTVETHISILGFQGEFVYKLKKAVRYPFIDLSTPEQRLADCEREVVLNRRLAPDVYLGVEAVVDDGGIVVDHVVVMQRLADSQRLASLAVHGGDAATCIDRLAALIARFHASGATGGSVDAASTRDAVAQLWEREIGERARYEIPETPSSLAARTADLARRYLAGRGALFDARIAAGHARDGHGDLLADDVFCLPDGPRVLDCLEFDEQLRFGDVVADVAFLAMDLERLGRTDLARRFLDRYRAEANDDWPATLEHFYIAYRAHVRSKVAALRNDGAQARELLTQACRHLEVGRVRLVLVGGPPATGKSTVARAIGRETTWPVLRSDEVRKELAGLSSTADARARLDEGLYTPAGTERTYTTLCDRAHARLERGCSVVLDASWSEPRWRAFAERVAHETASDLIALRCRAPVAITTDRAAARVRDHADASDATAAIAAVGAARFTPWPQARTLDTTARPEAVAEAALSALGPF